VEGRHAFLGGAKGPSYDPAVKRLAMRVEDHPLEYNKFEGIIPAGEYGGGTVMIWDEGTWTPETRDVDAAIERGDLKLSLDVQSSRFTLGTLQSRSTTVGLGQRRCATRLNGAEGMRSQFARRPGPGGSC